MPYRKVVFRAGQIYHLYNRGVNRGAIFFRPENWGYMVRLLGRYLSPELVDVLAYCLMPNHYHLLVYLKTDDFSRRVMQPFGVAYTKAVNKEQGRVGPIFQGPFQAVLVQTDEHLVHLSRYIHLNPFAAKLVDEPEEWVFSSYRDYVGLRRGRLPSPERVLGLFSSVQAYREFVAAEQDGRIIEGLVLE